MAQDNSSNKTVPINQRHNCIKFTQEQLKILVDAFNQKPYLDYATLQKLALEINIDESRIRICQEHEGDHLQEQIQGRARQHRTSYSCSQLHIPIKAFMSNPYPGIDSRQQLAKEIGVPESRVQIWFQNQRSRLQVQRKREHELPGQYGRQWLSAKQIYY
uniref:Homeobox domain-containing protein n=1 Tax=Castor canadensis TaxID=51338 RepID=A0A8C0ZN57_CASCN